MNCYTFIVRRSTVVFQFTVCASTLKAAKRHAARKIRADYPGFSTYRIDQSIY